MRKEVTETGKTVEEAIDKACRALRCERSDCEWEIIDLPKKSFFGLRVTPAKVRVYMESLELEDEKPKVFQASSEKPRATSVSSAQPVKKQNAYKTKPAKKAPIKAEKAKEQVPVKEEKTEKTQPVELSPEMIALFEEKETLACGYVKGILQEMGVSANIKVEKEQGGISINIEGDGLGVMIGRRGETLDAVQYLTGLVANRIGGEYLRITIDCGNYRSKRKDTLEVLARKIASQVLKTNTSRTLEPMNPFERRIIHATVSQIEGITSTSVGEEPNRRVMITTPTAKPGGNWAGSRGGRRDNRSSSSSRRNNGKRGGARGRGGNNNRKPSPQPEMQGPPKVTPESKVAGDKPLYGKIDLE